MSGIEKFGRRGWVLKRNSNYGFIFLLKTFLLWIRGLQKISMKQDDLESRLSVSNYLQ